MSGDEGGDDLEPLVIRMGGPSGTTPVAFVHLDIVGTTQIVRAILRPDLPTSVIAAQWAAALELSAGAGVMAQLATRDDEGAELWGPAELITPEVDNALDDQIDDDGTGGFLVGHDLLEDLWITYVGPVRIVLMAVSPPPPPE